MADVAAETFVDPKITDSNEALAPPAYRAITSLGANQKVVPSYRPFSLSEIADWVTIFGFIVTLGGFGVTLWVAARVRYIGRTFVFAARIKDYKRDLGKYCDSLNLHLAGLTINSHTAAQELLLCGVVLDALKKKAPNDIAAKAKATLSAIKKVGKSPQKLITKEWLEKILRELRTIEHSISEHIKDRNITPPK